MYITDSFSMRWPWVGILFIGIVCVIILGLRIRNNQRNLRGRQWSSTSHQHGKHGKQHEHQSHYSESQNTKNTKKNRWILVTPQLHEIEHFHALYDQIRTLRRIASVILTLILVVVAVMLTRPGTTQNTQSSKNVRDIVLCLDVSGSALPYDKAVIASYRDIVQQFQGERIGLSIFNSTSRIVFPLTDDYDLVQQQLNHAYHVLDNVQNQSTIDAMSKKQYQDIGDWLTGTQEREDSTSLIGDGLVSCAAMLPQFSPNAEHNKGKQQHSQQRKSMIVLATDNIVSGKPLYSLNEALDLTEQSHIVVDGLFTGPHSDIHHATAETMQREIQNHHGEFFSELSEESIPRIVQHIEQQSQTYTIHGNIETLQDNVKWFMLAFVGLWIVYLLVLARLRR